MNAEQLHQLDMLIATAMGKRDVKMGWTVYSGDTCIYHQERTFFPVAFQPTRNPADAMEVLGWLLEMGHEPVLSKIGNKMQIWNNVPHVPVEISIEGSLALAICLFAEKIINTNPSK